MMPKSRFSAGVYLVLVFLSGALVGGLSYRLYSVSSVSAVNTGIPKVSPAEFRRVYIDTIRTKVNLDSHQVDEVNQILDDTRAQFDDIHTKSRADIQAIYNQQIEKINAILRDDQKPAYAAFRIEREKMRQQMREKQQKK
jgi:hypothetical protein